MIESYGDQSTTQKTIAILSCFTNAASIALNASRDTTIFHYTLILSRVTHRNGAIKHVLPNQIHGGIISRFFFIHLSLHALALHLAVKYYFKIFLYSDLSTLALHTSVGCISLPKCQQDRTCYATNTIK